MPLNATEILFNNITDEVRRKVLGIWFEKSQIDFIPDLLFTEFKSLYLLKISGADIKVLKETYLEKMSPIKALELTRDNIQTVEENAFKELKNLEQLSLYANQIKTLPPTVFKHNLKLKVIDLNQNKLESLDENLFAGLVMLTEVSLHANEISRIPPKLFKSHDKIQKLLLNENRINEIDETVFQTLSNLTDIYLSTNNLETIPKNLFKYNKNLRSIYLNNNKLTSIDEGVFDGLDELFTVSLASNLFTTIPIHLFINNEKLDFLYLNNNQIRMLTPALFQSKKQRLRTFIDLSDNVCIDKKFDVIEMIGQELTERINKCENKTCPLDQDAKFFKTTILTKIVDGIKTCSDKCYEDESCLEEIVKERNSDVIFTIFKEISNNEKSIEQLKGELEAKLNSVEPQTTDTVRTLIKEQQDKTEELDSKFYVVASFQVAIIILLVALIVGFIIFIKRRKQQQNLIKPTSDSSNI